MPDISTVGIRHNECQSRRVRLWTNCSRIKTFTIVIISSNLHVKEKGEYKTNTKLANKHAKHHKTTI